MIDPQFDTRLTQIPPTILSDIAKIDELKGRWISGVQLHPVVLHHLKQSVLVTSTGASTRIEGAGLSDEDVEKLMRGISIKKFANRDAQEVQGYFELLQNVFRSWQTISFNENTIKHFHKELLKYVEKDRLHRGEYKKNENKVVMINAAGESVGVLFDTTPAYLTPSAMQNLVTWTQQALKEKTFHPLLVIGNFLIEFLNIHPFQDGNGRLSRILTNMLLLKAGYLYIPYVSHEKLVEQNKPKYYLALRTSQKTLKTVHANIIDWLSFFFQIILQQSKTAVALLSVQHIENTFSKNQLAVWQYLQQVTETSPMEIVKNTAVARPTLNQVLRKLIGLQRIERLGSGRSTRYRIIHNH